MNTSMVYVYDLSGFLPKYNQMPLLVLYTRLSPVTIWMQVRYSDSNLRKGGGGGGPDDS